ncbi:hypothetical protein SCHPADRAFT_855789 [Schizopora paradoxa]|uniref:Subtilisin-like protein n=1 Tax=Schizopora paradoxa TaxID=27342 RepID=A0A0H2RGS3_9AGAM|nr:hypothetical protein SCHPADRAFT_855789 [Schizopora paradoxa]
MFKDDVHPFMFEEHFSLLDGLKGQFPLEQIESGLNHVWNSHIKGYAGKFSREVMEMIRTQPEVDYIEQDQVVYALETQKSAPWGLARISHRDKLNFSTFTKYEYDVKGGEGVNVYVIDTGIYIDHEEFEGRARWGKTIPKNDQDIDGNGHGTHCAGTIGSRKYGVAKAATITAVKVLGTNGSGTMSDVVAGVVWAAEDAVDLQKKEEAQFKKTGQRKHKGSVANMSLGGGKSQALDDTVNRAVKTGLHFAVAAGNDNKDACDYSPAGATEAVTVGASTLVDERAYFSNFGKCVDVFAPGLSITSTWNSGKHSSNTISGTSMASPHTAGLLAYLLSIYPSATFNPSMDETFVPPALDKSWKAPVAFFSDVYASAYGCMPGFVTRVLPSPSLFNVAPIPAPVPVPLTPKLLKKALLALSSPGKLQGAGTDLLPPGTPNLLIFNNATDASGKSWIDNSFWSSL